MKKLTIFTLIGVVLILSGCTADDTTLNNNVNKPVANTNTNTNVNLTNNNLNENQVVNENQNTNNDPIVDPLANWKTNTKPLDMPLTYKFPPTWTIFLLGGKENIGWIKGPNDNPLFQVDELIELRDKGLTLQEAFNKSKPSNITAQESIKIDGYDAYKIQFQTLPSASRGKMGEEIIYVEYKDRIYTITFLDWDKEWVKDSPFYSTYQQILSTFKFIK